MKSNIWYFHRINGKGYKGGSFKGMDLSIGQQSAHAGILIRSVQKVEDEEDNTCGPCKTVELILSKNNQNDISSFVEKFGIEIFEGENAGLYLKKEALPKLQVYCGPRVGLSLKREHVNPELFIMRNYRFVVNPKNVSKHKNLLAVSLHAMKGMNAAEISKLINSNKSSVSNWISLVEEGKKKKTSDFKGKQISPKLACELYGCCLKYTYLKDKLVETEARVEVEEQVGESDE